MDSGIDHTLFGGCRNERAAATNVFDIEEGNVFASVRPTRSRRVSFQLANFSRIGAISIYRPELPLIFLAGGGKERDGFGVGRPGRVGIDPLASGFQGDGRSGGIT